MCDMKNRLFFSAVVLALIFHTALALGQSLTVQNESGKQTVLTRADIDTVEHVKVTTGAAGASATFEGVAVKALLEKAGVGFGESMKGKRMASYLLVEAADGYRVVWRCRS